MTNGLKISQKQKEKLFGSEEQLKRCIIMKNSKDMPKICPDSVLKMSGILDPKIKAKQR